MKYTNDKLMIKNNIDYPFVESANIYIYMLYDI